MFDLKVCLHDFSYLFNSDHNGWTALHHASMGGYTQTMKVILDTNLKCTDRLDEEGVGTRSSDQINLDMKQTSKLDRKRSS